MGLPNWFQGEIPIELLRLAHANCQKPIHRQILADWVERYGGEDAQLLCRFLRRGAVLRHDATTWLTLSESEARLVAPFSDLVLGIGDRVVLPLTGTQKITMAWVPQGENWIRSADGEFALGKGLWCGIYPVTQEQWLAVMGSNPSHFKGKEKKREKPVEQVSYNDVQDFLQKVNAANSKSTFLYRLPTVEEWEYIIRGGPSLIPPSKQFGYYFARREKDYTAVATNDLSLTQANFRAYYFYACDWEPGEKYPYFESTSAVGNYLPNPLGMYDMHGNVWEWTSTDVGSKYRCCGGSWNHTVEECGAAFYRTFHPDYRSNTIGFRLLAVPDGE